MRAHILLVDGNNLGWRGFGQVPLSHDGNRTEALFLGLNMLRLHLLEFAPDNCIVVWDAGHDRRRISMFPDYKKKRRELSDAEKAEREEFFLQMEYLKEFIAALSIPQCIVSYREADDVIYNLIKSKDPEKYRFTVASTDKDFYQLLTRENVDIFSPVKKELVTVASVEKEIDLPIKHYVAYKALVGDPSDSLPGVHGIGPKWAPFLIKTLFMIKDQPVFTRTQQKKLKIFFENSETFDKMEKLIRFMDIERKEMAAGFIVDNYKHMSTLHEKVLGLLMKFGATKNIEQFETFVQPFEQLIFRRQ